MSVFEGRVCAIATMHKKEVAIAPLFKDKLKMETLVPSDLDTDQFGQFSGTIQRVEDPVSTARLKCLHALELTGLDLAIASEGSFGPHPLYFGLPADEEWLLLYDKKLGLELVSRSISLETNYSSITTLSWTNVLEFAQKALFPEHGLVIYEEGRLQEMHKGIHDLKTLKKWFDLFNSEGKRVTVETDMRAMHNPTRMEVIANAAEKLTQKALSECPECGSPGFDIVEAIPGLPCSWCGEPTESPRAFIYACNQCACRQERVNPKKEKEDPQYCQFCNP